MRKNNSSSTVMTIIYSQNELLYFCREKPFKISIKRCYTKIHSQVYSFIIDFNNNNTNLIIYKALFT